MEKDKDAIIEKLQKQLLDKEKQLSYKENEFLKFEIKYKSLINDLYKTISNEKEKLEKAENKNAVKKPRPVARGVGLAR